jgi:hypothetical protein
MRHREKDLLVETLRDSEIQLKVIIVFHASSSIESRLILTVNSASLLQYYNTPSKFAQGL